MNKKKARAPSKLQNVCLQYGRDCWSISNNPGLARFLRSEGHVEAAETVAHLIRFARSLAKSKYYRERKKLQPNWKTWEEQLREQQLREELAHAEIDYSSVVRVSRN